MTDLSKPATPSLTAVLQMVVALGLVAGFGVIGRQMMITDFPVDMIIYLEGVRAFLDGGEMYSVPMFAGDLALPFIYPPFGALVMVPFTAVDNDLAGDLMIILSAGLVLVCLWFVLRAFGAGEVVRSRMVGVRPAYVWDVSQTAGEPIPEPPSPVLMEGEAPDGLWDGLAQQVRAAGFELMRVPLEGMIRGANGLTDFEAKTVAVRENMDPAAQVKTLAHELAHVLMHDPDREDARLHRVSARPRRANSPGRDGCGSGRPRARPRAASRAGS